MTRRGLPPRARGAGRAPGGRLEWLSVLCVGCSARPAVRSLSDALLSVHSRPAIFTVPPSSLREEPGARPAAPLPPSAPAHSITGEQRALRRRRRRPRCCRRSAAAALLLLPPPPPLLLLLLLALLRRCRSSLSAWRSSAARAPSRSLSFLHVCSGVSCRARHSEVIVSKVFLYEFYNSRRASLRPARRARVSRPTSRGASSCARSDRGL